jgi:hypothetical protein
LKRLAYTTGRTPAALVREAVVEYAARHAPARRARSVGAFRSGRRNLGSKADAHLKGFGEDK